MDDDWEEYDPSRGSFLDHMIAGSIAGVVEHVAMFPVDTYKTHQQFEGISAAAASASSNAVAGSSSSGFIRGAAAAPLSSHASFLSLLRKEGFTRLWRGAPAMVVGCVPSHAAFFSSYELCKERFGANAAGHHPIAAAASGAIATTLHDAVLTPLDVVKQRLQLGYYRGVWDCVTTMLREEGLRSLYRSYPTTVLMNMPYAAAVVASNESIKKVLTADATRDATMLTYLLSGAGAGAFAAAITCPMDAIKTRLQTSALVGRLKVDEGGESTAAAAARSNFSSSGATSHSTSSRASSTAGAQSPSPTTSVRSAASASSAAAAAGVGVGVGGNVVGAGAAASASTHQKASLYTAAAVSVTQPPSSSSPFSATAASAPFPRSASSMGALELATAMWAKEGPRVFFRGVGARMMVHAPSSAISWATYEWIKGLLVQGRGTNGEVR